MASRVSELNDRLGRKASGQSSGATGDNLRRIETLVNEAYEAGLITRYEPLNAHEKEEIAKFETDEIANAHHVEMEADDKVYYITYKPQVKKNGNKQSKLEHVNRSTPFVEMLLNRVDTDYSFLYCHSKAQATEIPDPVTADGFIIKDSELSHDGGQNKFELFLLIECKDEIANATDSLKNIIDSVLIDVDDTSRDLFAHMSYASLEHTTASGSDFTPEVDAGTQAQLNQIIVDIRTSQPVRQRLLDFLLQHKESNLYKHIARRNEAFCAARDAGQETNALNSSVECHVSPIGVFLNEISNDRLTYTVEGAHGEKAKFYTDINPITPFTGHVCPHCHKPIDGDNRLVVADTYKGAAVGCTACAKKCVERSCTRYTFTDGGCVVCGKTVCTTHAKKSVDSNDCLCSECATVFRDSASGAPLAPRDACVRGETEDYVAEAVGRLGKTEAMNRFRGTKLLRKKMCVLCRTRTDKKYYLKEETLRCDKCLDSFYKGDVKKATGSDTLLCIFDRVDCSCGKTVDKDNALSCSESGCTNGFCADCAQERVTAKDYAHAVKLLKGKPRPLDCNGKLYCPEHATVCKVCGRVVPRSQAKYCSECGGLYCPECKVGSKCATCGNAERVNDGNYKQVSSKTRAARLNALSFGEKVGKTAVLEDNETLIFVSLKTRGKRTRVYNKLTGKLVKDSK